MGPYSEDTDRTEQTICIRQTRYSSSIKGLEKMKTQARSAP